MELTEKEVKDKANALRNLVSFRGKSEDYLIAKAEEILHKERSGIDMTSMFTDRKETKRGRELLEKYLSDYAIEAISDKNALKEVIYLEIVQTRLQEKLNGYYKKDSKAVPIQLIEVIHKNSEAILKLKASLGLNREKQKSSAIDALAILKIRFKQWLSQNQGTRTLVCPHKKCGKMIMLKIRTTAWIAQKHPYFRDRILANKHLTKLYMDKVLTREDVAKILDSSTDYIDWVVERWAQNKAVKEEQKVNIKEVKLEALKEPEVENKNLEAIREEVIKNNNTCPDCSSGFLFCTIDKDSIGWIEKCTNCTYKAIHKDRRLKQEDISFGTRRKKN